MLEIFKVNSTFPNRVCNLFWCNMLKKEIFGFLANLFYSHTSVFDGIESPLELFFKFANTILQNANMELIAPNSRNKYRLEKRLTLLVSS